MAEEWTDAELDAAVEAYLEMLAHQTKGEDYSKTEFRKRALEGALRARTDASFEFRMRNISHVLETEFHSDWLIGYRPAENVGAATTARIRSALERRLGGGLIPAEPTFDATALQKRTDAARTRIRKSGGALKPKGNAKPKSKISESVIFERDPSVKAWVLENAKGVCEACQKPGPFRTSAGEPFLEVHHVTKLADGGPDVIENAVAICPNCHREAHLGADQNGWAEVVRRQVVRLRS